MGRPDRAAAARRASGFLAAMGLAALAAGCGTSKEVAGMTCPRIVPASATTTIAIMRPGGHDVRDVEVAGKLMDAATTCQREKDGVAVMTEITFYAERIDLRTPDTVLPYFVALVDPQQQVAVREGFQLAAKFFPGEGSRTFPAEKITIHLPLKNLATANAYTVVIGFQLTPDQLAFNRALHAQQP